VTQNPNPKSAFKKKSLPKITILRNTKSNPPFKTTQTINKNIQSKITIPFVGQTREGEGERGTNETRRTMTAWNSMNGDGETALCLVTRERLRRWRKKLGGEHRGGYRPRRRLCVSECDA
jgi:hypothetical protein